MNSKNYILLFVFFILAFGISCLIYWSRFITTDDISPLMDLASPVETPSVTPVTITEAIDTDGLVVTSTMLQEEYSHVLELAEKAQHFYQSGDYENSVSVLNQAIEINRFPAFFNDRASAYLSLGEYDKALQDYNTALEIDPQFGLAFYNRGRLHHLMGDSKKAIADLEQSILLDQALRYAAYNNIALIHYDNSDYQLALNLIDLALDIRQPQLSSAYRIRGDIHLALKQYQKAIDDFQLALEENKNNGKAKLGLGKAYYYTEQSEVAIEPLRSATRLSSVTPETWFTLGLNYLVLDNKEFAYEAYLNGVKLLERGSTVEDSNAYLNQAMTNLSNLSNQPSEVVEQIVGLLEAQQK